tara:strand:+ start:256 stop:480 length:225 start_codon:yes stop_codon:yes gene_type:complete
MAQFEKREETVDLIKMVEFIVNKYPQATGEKILAQFGAENEGRARHILQKHGKLPKDKVYHAIEKCIKMDMFNA